jgi:hypothetical protein
VPSIVDDIRARIEERVSELAPLVSEYEQLMRLKRQLDEEAGASPASRSRVRERPARRRPGGAPRATTRAEQSVALVARRPGITTADIANDMGIDRNYLYRVLPRLEKEGRLVRRDGGWHVPAGASR